MTGAATSTVPSTPPAPVQWSTSWRLDLDEQDVVVAAGVDRRVRIHGLGQADIAELQRWASSSGPVRIGDDQQAIAERLVALGTLVPAWRTPDALHVIGGGSFAAKLLGALEREVREDGFPVVLRTGDEWPATPDRPHLAVDCSMHHTLVLGPYVVPGLSACTGCLTTRVARRWPHGGAAPEPGIQRRPQLIAELLAVHLDLIERGSSPLVNATMSWDVEQGRCDRQVLLKSPGCGLCDRARRRGRLHLPWPGASR